MSKQKDEASDMATVAQRISKQIQPLLKGHPPFVQSAVLADLLSLWLAGLWPPEAREELLRDFIKVTRDMVPESEKELFGPYGHPFGRRRS
jgi:hypothetical protein